jgi:hypothetical protein
MKIDKIINDKDEIDEVTKSFFSTFTNKGKLPRVELLKNHCIERVLISKNTNGHTEIYDLHSFIQSRLTILTNGTLLDFEEKELTEVTIVKGYIAQRISEYKKEGILNNVRFYETGSKMFQFLKIDGHWKISSLIWNDN